VAQSKAIEMARAPVLAPPLKREGDLMAQKSATSLPSLRGAEGDVAIQRAKGALIAGSGWLRFARNDGFVRA
jgi:hypothetical protein